MMTMPLITPTSVMRNLFSLIFLKIYGIKGATLVLQLLVITTKTLPTMTALIMKLAVLVLSLILIIMETMVVLLQPLR